MRSHAPWSSLAGVLIRADGSLALGAFLFKDKTKQLTETPPSSPSSASLSNYP